jgi:hypothetical protein
MMQRPSARRLAMSLVLLAGAALLAAVVLPGRAADEKKPAVETKFSPEAIAFFEKEVLPILKENCLQCHGGGKTRGGLKLLTRAQLLKGGDGGPAISLDKPDESRLLTAIHYKDDTFKMPPKGKLPAKEIDILVKWVRAGAPWTPGDKVVVDTPKEEGGKVTPESRKYWAYRPLERPEVPAVQNKAWVRNPIDAFLLAKLEDKGLTPAKPADRVALIRRATFDLIGLPPTPEEVEAFVKDKSADAYEKLIDRLLASPHYGEKWGRHWLDLMRYAETNGYERDSAKPFAWRYRDYVINAFNSDKPYDQFIREQLAGDELDKVTAETLIATGYYRLGIWDDEPADRELARYDVLDGIVSTTGQVFLGMTVGCARCHDHKRDPIPQRDYYRLLAFFQDVTNQDGKNLRRVPDEEARREQERLLRDKQIREGKLYQEIYQIEQKFAAALAEKKGIKDAALPKSDMVDLHYRFYRDTWEKLPDFDSLKFEAEGSIAHNFFTLAPASRLEAIGLVFEGKLLVPAKGEYTFSLDSTDGARLIVDGKKAIDRPGRGKQSAEGRAMLPAGPVSIRLEYFNTYSRPSLQVAWSSAAMSRRSLTAEGEGAPERLVLPDSRREGQTWSYTTTPPKADWTDLAFKEDGWKKGVGGFGTSGTPGAVVRTTWNTKNIWLRKKFTLEHIPSSLAIDLHHDDDVTVWLNDSLVYKAKGYLVEYKRFLLHGDALKVLKKGENVLAIHCLQTTGGQYIDAGLVEARPRDNVAVLLREHGPELLGKETVDRYVQMTAELARNRRAPIEPGGMQVMSVTERGRGITRVLKRGNPALADEKVEPGVPEVLVKEPIKVAQLPETASSSGKRRALAEWLTDAKNPVTARVMANRLWQYHFGRGIVPTSSDFGKLGEAPTHPELLDWLATEFMRGGWKIKRMHKLLMMSSAYQMSSKASTEGLKLDPANMLFWRFNMRRLAAEEVRDSILSVSSKLNPKMGGPSIYPPIPKEVLAGQSVPGQGWPTSAPDEASRRSVYVHVKRSLLVPILSVHDQADTDSSCAVRYTTTVPTQALGMLNGDFTNEQAGYLAERLKREAPDDLAAQVRRAIRLTTGRTPEDEEVKKDVAFVKAIAKKSGLREADALKRYCLMTLNTNEFVYLD